MGMSREQEGLAELVWNGWAVQALAVPVLNGRKGPRRVKFRKWKPQMA